VVIYSYRHRFGLVLGDPAVEKTEQLLTKQPKICVPTIALIGDNDGVTPSDGSDQHHFFTGKYEQRALPGVGHNSTTGISARLRRSQIVTGIGMCMAEILSQ